jgi:hypothetical protein
MGADLRVRVTGRSMGSFLRDGDVVTLANPARSPIRMGDVVLFGDAGGRLVLHRVVAQRFQEGRRLLQTRGDAVFRAEGPVEATRVLGKAVRVERLSRGGEHRDIDLQSPRWKALNLLFALMSRGLILQRIESAVNILDRCSRQLRKSSFSGTAPVRPVVQY